MAGATDFREACIAAVVSARDRARCDRSRARGLGCSFAPQGEGRVGAVIDARTFRMDDGREVRLAGIETVTDGSAALVPLLPAAMSPCAERPMRRTVTAGSRLSCLSNRPQHRCRTSCSHKATRWSPATVADKACAAELAAAEAAARRARRGIWADSAAIKNAESPGDILARIGQFTVVEGKVLSVRQAGATTYINFGRRWTRDFAVTISRRVVPAFEAAGISLKSLENKRIRVRGWIEARGGPRIEALHVGQIELAGEN